MIKIPCVAGAFVAIGLSVHAATTIDQCTDELLDSDTLYTKSSLINGGNWKSGSVPGLGSTNYIANGKTLYGPRKVELEKTAFQGDCFVLAGTISMHSGVISWKDLRLQNGSTYGWGSASALNGLVRVESDDSSPAKIQMFFGSSATSVGSIVTKVNAKFVGEAGTSLVLKRSGTKPAASVAPDHYYQIIGDWSECFSTVTVATNTAISFSTAEVKRFGGKIVVERGGYYLGINAFGDPDDVYTSVGSLEMQDGSCLMSKVDSEGNASLVVVTNQLLLGEVEVKFHASTFPAYAMGGEFKIPLFKLQGAAAERVPDLSKVRLPDYPQAQKFGALLPDRKELVCTENADGSKTIYARYYAVIDWTMNTANGQNSYSDCAFNPVNGSYWVNGAMPNSESSGIAYATKNILWWGSSSGFNFPNVAFVIGANMYMYCLYINVSNLILKSGVALFTHKSPATKYLRGKLTVDSGDGTTTTKIYNYNNSDLYIEAELLGDGALEFRPDSNAKPSATYRFTANNENFHGSMLLGRSFSNKVNNVYYPYPDLSKSWFHTIYLNDGRNLGGVYSRTDAWKAVTVCGLTKLKINSGVETVEIAEPTRGIFITKGGAQVEPAAGQTLTVKSPVTYGGKLRKLGDGCLALGGEARFIDGKAETQPLAGTNLIEIVAGSLKVLATNSVDGVQMEFSGTGTLAVDAGNESEGFAQYGFVNTRWHTPFVPAAAGAAIPVRIDGLPDGCTTNVPFCTVLAEAAENLTFNVANVPHCFDSVITRENPDGRTVTFIASFKPQSLRIHIR